MPFKFNPFTGTLDIKSDLTMAGGDARYLKLDQTTPQTISNGIPLLASDHPAITESHQIVDKEYVDLAVTALNTRFYLLNTASGVGSYKLTSLDPSSDAETNVTSAALGAGDTLLQGWISPVGAAPTQLVKGIYDLYIHAEKTVLVGTKNLYLYWTLVEYKVDTSEVLVATSEVSDAIGAKSGYDTHVALTDNYTPAAGSRIVGKVYARVSGSGADPVAKLYYRGTTGSNWEIPTNTEVLESLFLMLDQTTPQTVVNGIPVITEGLTLGDPSGDYIKWTYGEVTSTGPLAGLYAWIITPWSEDLMGSVSVQRGGIYLQYSPGDDPPGTESNAGIYFISEDGTYIASLLQDNNTGNIVLMMDVIGDQLVTIVSTQAGGLSFPQLTDNGFLKTSGSSGALSVDTSTYLTSVAFADLTDYPADSAGTLTNDGAGNLSWVASQPLEQAEFEAGENLTAGQICYLKSDGCMWLAKGDAESTSINLLAVSLDSPNDGNTGTFLIRGATSGSSLSIGVPYYLSVSTGGAKTTTRPSSSTNIVRVLGYAVTASAFFFCPDNTWVTV
jgi:hypothetical protein